MDSEKSFLERIKQNSEKRRKLLAKQFGLRNPNDLTQLLGFTQEREAFLADQKQNLRRKETQQAEKCANGSEHGGSEVNDDDEMTYTESTIFLKGTQSANPHNDYCQYFVDTNQRPQNFIRDVGMNDRFVEFPKLNELIKLKDELVSKTATPPVYLKCDLRKYDIEQLGGKFDVILVEPPLEDYQRTNGVSNIDFYNWEEIMRIKIEEIAAPRSFIFLWCGAGDGLDYGRQCLRKWGFRRCEDICWIKSNKNQVQKQDLKSSQNLDSKSIFQRTKEHCLMGIKGTVRRSIDGNFIHANVDIDLIITEEFEYGSLRKPDEIFHIIEHFCLGKRRLHIFGRDDIIRPGWLSVGPALTHSNFNAELYSSYFKDSYVTGCTERIEQLRPKSPPPKGGKMPSNSGGNRSQSSFPQRNVTTR